jgi:hypothetical protein
LRKLKADQGNANGDDIKRLNYIWKIKIQAFKIWCCNLNFFWCSTFICLFLIGGHKRPIYDVHIPIEVILVSLWCLWFCHEMNFLSSLHLKICSKRAVERLGMLNHHLTQKFKFNYLINTLTFFLTCGFKLPFNR